MQPSPTLGVRQLETPRDQESPQTVQIRPPQSIEELPAPIMSSKIVQHRAVYGGATGLVPVRPLPLAFSKGAVPVGRVSYSNLEVASEHQLDMARTPSISPCVFTVLLVFSFPSSQKVFFYRTLFVLSFTKQTL